MPYPFRNLVFEGGGVKGIAYVGALEVLEEKGILSEITRVAGTSAGAINAVLLGLGYTGTELRDVLWSLDFRKFLDDDWGVVRDTERLLTEYGWYKGDFFHAWISRLVAAKTGNANATFREAHGQPEFRDIYLYGTNLSTRYGEVFSFEHTPLVRIADAVRISMSIPLFFKSFENPRGDRYVDGGVLNNYPVQVFDRVKYVETPDHRRATEYYDRQNAELAAAHPQASPHVYNQETLGFRLDSGAEIAVLRDGAEPPHQVIGDFFDYCWALIETVLNAQESQHLHSDDWHRTIYIDTVGVGTTDFGLKDERKGALVASGREHAEEYFDWYDHPESKPANRPG
jgi:NTE family protein